MTTAAAKDAARRQWNQTPCGTGDYLAGLTPASLEWFDAIRKSRYEITDRWMQRVIPWEVGRGARLLEIGHGIGSDLLTFAEHGADCSGIEITEEHHRLCRRNFELHGRPVSLKLCDATELDYPSNTFSVVYSSGVLHHTPDTVRCVGEAYRVLKVGGMLILTLYHTWSLAHAYWLVHRGLLKGDLKRLGYRGLMATMERGADGKSVCPLVKTYSRPQLHTLLADFRSHRLLTAHVPRLPGASFLEGQLGWYLVAFARK